MRFPSPDCRVKLLLLFIDLGCTRIFAGKYFKEQELKRIIFERIFLNSDYECFLRIIDKIWYLEDDWVIQLVINKIYILHYVNAFVSTFYFVMEYRVLCYSAYT